MLTLSIASLGRTALRAALSSSAASTLLLTTFVGSAAAQQPTESKPEEPVQEVVVTGIRHGIEDAIKVKEDSGSIVEAISAEDLGKLPDTSIAESISRLPGITSQRAEGRASAISLRGTDPGFTTTLLNGREQVSTGDNRSIEFDQYPSELLSSVVVYKTPDARLVGQGLAGTIELRTARPLEYGRRALAFNLRGERNSDSGLGADSTDKGYRASLSYIDQYADNKVGLTLGVARLNSPLATEGYGTYEPWGPNGAGVFTTGGMKVRTDMGDNTRDGAMAALEFRPLDSFTSTLDLYYTKSHEKDNARSIEVNVGGYPAPCCDGDFADAGITQFGITNPTLRENSTVAGTLSTVLPLVRNFQFITDDKIFATGWNNRWSNGGWTLLGDVSYSRATRDQFQPENNAEYVPDTRPSCTTPNVVSPNCHETFQPTPGGPLVDAPRNDYDTGQYALAGSSMPSITFQKDYTDPTQVQLGPTIYGTGYVKKPHVQDELKSGRIDLARDLSGWFDQVAFGVNYADRSKDKKSPESGLSTIAGGFTQIAPQYLLSPTNLGYASAPSVLAWDVPAVMAAYYKPIVYGDPTTLSYLIGKWWTVHEKLTTSYVRGDLNHPLTPSITLKGNVGLQVINTNQSSDSFFHDSATNAVTPFSDGKKYTDVLPETNFVFQLPDQQAVRLGLAREVARPRMDQLKASDEIGAFVNGGFLQASGSAGNPRLDPWRADAADLSYEKYFSTHAYASVAAFYKKLKSYIFNQTDTNHDFSAFMATLPPNFDCLPGPPVVCPPRTNFGPLSGPVNGQGGTLKGVELTASLPGDLVSEGLRHFGTILSLSQTDSNIAINDGGGTNVISGNNLGRIPLPGLSKTVWSATFYYENAGFSARVATRYRSKYIGEVVNFANDRAFKFVKADEITDFQTGYEFSGGLKGLSLLFQINNMFNSPYIAYQRFESQEIDYQLYGRQFLFGVNYRIE